MSAEPFPTVAAPKSQRIVFRGVTFTLKVSDSEFDGHIHVVLTADKPPRGLDNELYILHMKPPGGVV